MAINNRIELNGNLGADAKLVEKNGKQFVALRLATTDSYPVEENGQTVWKDKDTVWHDVLAFRPITVSIAKDLKKGNRVRIAGSVSYKPFKDENGYNQKVAVIIASYIEKVELSKKDDEPSNQEIDEAVAEVAAA